MYMTATSNLFILQIIIFTLNCIYLYMYRYGNIVLLLTTVFDLWSLACDPFIIGVFPGDRSNIMGPKPQAGEDPTSRYSG